MNRVKKVFLFLFVYVTLQSCGVYKFTGASLHPDDKTVTIKYFKNQASLVNPTLSQEFTETLKDKFLTQTNLELTDFDGDLIFEGEIVQYQTKPVAITQDETAEYNRLTVGVRVKYTGRNNEKYSFDETITKYVDYKSSELLTDVEDELTEKIVDEITETVFNKAVVNW
ncbi:MAG: LptE family protein [Bacteroidota bacterium]|nr:LptE family protein [Bacteroidota bacterium]